MLKSNFDNFLTLVKPARVGVKVCECKVLSSTQEIYNNPEYGMRVECPSEPDILITYHYGYQSTKFGPNWDTVQGGTVISIPLIDNGTGGYKNLFAKQVKFNYLNAQGEVTETVTTTLLNASSYTKPIISSDNRIYYYIVR